MKLNPKTPNIDAICVICGVLAQTVATKFHGNPVRAQPLISSNTTQKIQILTSLLIPEREKMQVKEAVRPIYTAIPDERNKTAKGDIQANLSGSTKKEL
tara:strand:+ start:330 stop:626 length:297 start_codon:yes stop_codon:yes gene_type:complete